MTETKLITSLFDRLNQNQLALGAALDQRSKWIEPRGSADLANKVCGVPETLDENLVLFRQGSTALTVAAVWANREEANNSGQFWIDSAAARDLNHPGIHSNRGLRQIGVAGRMATTSRIKGGATASGSESRIGRLIDTHRHPK
ncbi:hypothetical protein ACW9H6_28000 [Pseudomonas sp. SDO528_S397]